MGKLTASEKDGTPVWKPGRLITWMQTPETTGGQYCSVCSVRYDPGEKMRPAHAHDKGEETVYVVAGRGTVKVGTEVCALEPGKAVLFPQGVPHIIRNDGLDPLHLVCFYAPCQEAIESTEYEDFDFDEADR